MEPVKVEKKAMLKGLLFNTPLKNGVIYLLKGEFMLSNHEKTIYFENQYSEYGYFSNFYKSPFWVEGKIYQTN